ncbi:MAG: hypothetical protein IJ213_08675 [Bacteroidales bacterium]|nr:hypothetical protein [Bacteroidales bacterium]
MKRLYIAVVFMCLFAMNTYSQIENLKLNGYVQTDFAVVGKDGKAFIGPAWSEARDGNSDYYFRYGVKRGLIRGTFSSGKGKGALEINVTEAGVIPLVAFGEYDFTDWFSMQAGLLNIDFGYELMYPSSKLETLERSMHTQMLFPKEHDLGFQTTFKLPISSQKSNLTLSLALMSGNGINKIADKNMNFMSHLKYDYSAEKYAFGLGFSWYEGKTNNADTLFHEIKNSQWLAKQVDANRKNTRRYINFEAELDLFNSFGTSSFRTECTFGIQPSQEKDFTSQDGNSYNINNAFSYSRHFLGAYLYYIQQLGTTPFMLIAKYAYLDKNTQLSSSQITNPTDAAFNNFGIGLKYNYNEHISMEIFYDKYTNEHNSFVKELKDDVCHLRLQYLF